MAMDSAFYLVTKEMVVRCGLLGKRYQAADGRYIVDNKDLSRVRFTTDEIVSGLRGVEKISAERAKQLIARNGYVFGVNGNEQSEDTENGANEGGSDADNTNEENNDINEN